MKKIMLSLAMALVSVCASAQVYIGGTKVGFLGYRGYSPDHGDNSSTFGLNVDASNISFGAIYKF